ncbi:ABC-2 family transporter protein [Paenibacillus sophorae]|uniref:ABC transporter permease n=1 Tax=Paenibacillus sophorae TaxID=1333845 RepID=A0A1H8FDD0_9BACL|nr:ABC transporter permease [Paenibacillus sophorae]QWU13836.1 ABC transporter permease [Paenibacillus sophorae]SEN29504.1 ABC-2 family transporter protein [Paenibacillus sophorae]
MNTVKELLKMKTTIIGIATALLFQLVFSIIWMTGYEGMSDRIDELSIAVVNEDAQSGAVISKQLSAGLPVHVETAADMESARDRLEDRHIQMIVHIPAGFTSLVAGQDSKASIQYVVNESNPAMIKSIMTSIASQVTAAANKQAIAAGAHTVLSQGMPAEKAAAVSGVLSERVVSDIQSVNIVNGTNNQMVPMMMVLASFVGAMIMAQNLEISMTAISDRTGRLQRLGARFAITIPVAIIVSLVGTSLVMLLGGQVEQGFLALWGFQTLFVLTFMIVAQTLLVLLGTAGMLLNIVLLSVQLVSSGAMMPREMLSGFYFNLGGVLPATYAVEGLMNLLFGGPGIGSIATALLVIAAVMALVMIGMTALRREPASNEAVAPAGQTRSNTVPES